MSWSLPLPLVERPAPTRPTGGDVVRMVVAAAIVVPVTVIVDRELASESSGVGGPWLLLLGLVCIPVAFARSARLASALAAVAIAVVLASFGFPLTGPMVLALGMVGVTASRAEVPFTGSLGIVSGLFVAGVAFARADSEQLLGVLGGFAVGALPALVGGTLRAERIQARDARELARRVEELRDRDVQRAVEKERLRIVRDVHDITGHHLSAIALQAGGAGRLTEDSVARSALARIHELAHGALGQTRGVLGVLRDHSESAELVPSPQLEDVAGLLEPARDAGISVDLRVTGHSRPLPEAVELCAYRIVQESLTNVLRHSAAHCVLVEIDYRPDALGVSVLDDGVGDSAATTGGGAGLKGMHERVALVGGGLDAGARAAGGWGVTATLPLADAS